MATTEPRSAPVIRASGAGIRFRRNRTGRRSFKDLFAGRDRRARPGEFWALRGIDVTVHEGEGEGTYLWGIPSGRRQSRGSGLPAAHRPKEESPMPISTN